MSDSTEYEQSKIMLSDSKPLVIYNDGKNEFFSLARVLKFLGKFSQDDAEVFIMTKLDGKFRIKKVSMALSLYLFNVKDFDFLRTVVSYVKGVEKKLDEVQAALSGEIPVLTAAEPVKEVKASPKAEKKTVVKSLADLAPKVPENVPITDRFTSPLSEIKIVETHHITDVVPKKEVELKQTKKEKPIKATKERVSVERSAKAIDADEAFGTFTTLVEYKHAHHLKAVMIYIDSIGTLVGLDVKSVVKAINPYEHHGMLVGGIRSMFIGKDQSIVPIDKLADMCDHLSRFRATSRTKNNAIAISGMTGNSYRLRTFKPDHVNNADVVKEVVEAAIVKPVPVVEEKPVVYNKSDDFIDIRNTFRTMNTILDNGLRGGPMNDADLLKILNNVGAKINTFIYRHLTEVK